MRTLWLQKPSTDMLSPLMAEQSAQDLPGHVESGEERFLIEWDRTINQVFYDILAFSKPNHMLTRLGYPFVRQRQNRFGRDSFASIFVQ